MIVLTQQVFIGEIEVSQTLQFDSVEGFVAYCEYEKGERK